jgi:membrane protein DedA with SNARE-associated domain
VIAELEAVILAWVAQVYQAIGWYGVAFLMAIESACIPLPSELIMPLAGWMLIQKPGLGPEYLLLAGLAGAAGNAAGSAAAYWAGAAGGRPFLERYGRWVLISRHDLEVAERWFGRYGAWAVFFSRLLPVIRTFIRFPAGIARMNFPLFIVLTFIGSFPWSVALAFAGYLLGEHWEAIRSVMRPLDVPIIIGLLVLAVFFIRRRLKEYQAGAPVSVPEED